jgi:hypothetical protein
MCLYSEASLAHTLSHTLACLHMDPQKPPPKTRSIPHDQGVGWNCLCAVATMIPPVEQKANPNSAYETISCSHREPLISVMRKEPVPHPSTDSMK